MIKSDINNWKLKEVINEIEIVHENSSDYIDYILKKLNLPIADYKSIDRRQTHIDWNKIDNYYKFFFDGEGQEKENELALKTSELSKKDKLIITYGFNEPAIIINTSKFIREWEDFIASTQWETIIFSEDFKLIMEVSRDYYLHSNFKIK